MSPLRVRLSHASLALGLLTLSAAACNTTASVPPSSAANGDETRPDPGAAASTPDDQPSAPSTVDGRDTDGAAAPGTEVMSSDDGGDGGEAVACNTAADCPDDHVCEGKGCGDMEGRCQPNQRMCTRDLRPYCGCDGETFRSSGSCPGKRFSREGPCEQQG